MGGDDEWVLSIGHRDGQPVGVHPDEGPAAVDFDMAWLAKVQEAVGRRGKSKVLGSTVGDASLSPRCVWWYRRGGYAEAREQLTQCAFGRRAERDQKLITVIGVSAERTTEAKVAQLARPLPEFGPPMSCVKPSFPSGIVGHGVSLLMSASQLDVDTNFTGPLGDAFCHGLNDVRGNPGRVREADCADFH